MVMSTNNSNEGTVVGVKRSVDDVRSSSSSKGADALVSTTTKELKCNVCGDNSFSSRNKLFSHLKLCSSDLLTARKNQVADQDFNNSVDAYIYVTGGRIRGKTLGCVERYSFRRDKWEVCPSMIENRGSHGAAFVGESLYVVGGGGFKSNLASNEKFDCKTQQWSLVASMPTSRHALSILSMDNYVYAIGGWIDGSISSGHVERYDVSSNKWDVCASMNVPRRLLAATVQNGKIYTFGGNSEDGDWYSDAAEVYSPITNTWSDCAAVSIAGQCSAASVDQYIYVFVHGKQVLRYCPSKNQYLKLSALPLPDWFCFDVTVINEKIYLLGGATQGKWVGSMYQYDCYADSWKAMPSMSKHRRRCAATAVFL